MKIKQLLEARTPNVVMDLLPKIREAIVGLDEAQAKQLILTKITNYFDVETWSLEKEEWEKMTTDQRMAFVDTIYAKTVR